MSSELYRNLSTVYDRLGLGSFSENFGKAMLRYFGDTGFSPSSGLDLCCGTGCLCGLLSAAGIYMSGIDLSEEMIRIAKENFPKIPFTVGDAAGFSLEQKVDLITCIDDSVNHFTSPSDLSRLFDRVSESLTEGGLFLFDIAAPDALTFDEPYSIEGGGLTGTYRITRPEKDLAEITLTVTEEGKELLSVCSVERLYDRTQIWEMLLDSGLTMPVCTKHFYNENTGIKYKIVAQK